MKTPTGAVSSQQNGDQIKLVAEHQNYAVLAKFLMQLSQMGLSIQKWTWFQARIKSS